MKISGFTFVRNAENFYYPIKESIESILPICDEFVVALATSTDKTEEIVQSIGSDKVKVIHSQWKVDEYPKNTEFARQTNIAKEACTGDWLFYLQGDECIHENDLDKIVTGCQKEIDNKEVEGFLFNYKHFWGDYQHFNNSHAWYAREMRIVRNLPDIYSWRDAQSFRKFERFTHSFADYRKKKDSRKLRVKPVNATVFHYGYVRPPHLMSVKRKSSSISFHGLDARKDPTVFDYGPLHKLPVYTGTHPRVMHNRIAQWDWADKLQYSGKRRTDRPIHKHEKLRYKLVSWVENRLLGGHQIAGFKNYVEIK